MKVWIDLSNSPHPLLFAPVARRLEELGHEVIVTARDNAQTAALALERWPHAAVIGGPSPAGRAGKAAVLARRIRELRSFAGGRGVDIALSHNSYAQIVAARSLRLPIVTAMDFEHQPANHLAFRLADLVLLPEALPLAAVRRQGATESKVRHYPGLKEELYLGDFEPDRDPLARLGLADGPGPVVVTRTPPTRALYHGRSNALYMDILASVARQDGVRCVVLPRHPEQREELGRLGLDDFVVPDRAVDSRSLMYAADLVVGAGGTMTREAALLGVPTVSVFAGRRPRVDDWLEERGLMRHLTSVGEIGRIETRPREPRSLAELVERTRAVVYAFVDAVVSAG